MAPAMFFRVERRDNPKQGPWCGTGICLDASEMPIWSREPDIKDVHKVHSYRLPASKHYFAFTYFGLHTWLSEDDRVFLTLKGYVLRTYVCPPGTFFLSPNQAIFELAEAHSVETRSLLARRGTVIFSNRVMS